MIRGRDVSRFFPDAVICMHRQSNDLKKLCYIILTETYPLNKENSLMPINILHKVFNLNQFTFLGTLILEIYDLTLNITYQLRFSIILIIGHFKIRANEERRLYQSSWRSKCE